MSQPASGDVVVLDTVVLSLLAARSRRPEVVAHIGDNDLWIAATASAHGI